MRKTVLVTGAAGFIGSHLVDRLLSEGYAVIGLDNLTTGELRNLDAAGKDPHFHFEIGDVRDTLKADARFVFNLACPASPRHYRVDPHATITASVLGALRVVEHARSRACRIVHASTSEVYGDPLEHPQSESYWGNVNPIGDRACYDEGKRVAETIFTDASRRLGVDARIVRIFNTYGPRMALNDGRVIPNFMVQVLQGGPITIYGDGRQSRAFCYVDDLVDGLVRAGVVDSFDSPLNLGNSSECSINELADTILRVANKRVAIHHGPLPPDDPRRRCPDLTKAMRVLGFVPRVPLETGIQRAYQDFARRVLATAASHIFV